MRFFYKHFVIILSLAAAARVNKDATLGDSDCIYSVTVVLCGSCKGSCAWRSTSSRSSVTSSGVVLVVTVVVIDVVVVLVKVIAEKHWPY